MFSSGCVTLKPRPPQEKPMADDRLTILSEYFYPESSSTSQLLTELATGLTDRFDVDCITALPNYHAHDRERSVPQQETHDSVRIHRVRNTRFDKDDLPKRLINWITYTVGAGVALLRNHTDVVLVVSNPPTLPAAAWVKKRLHGTPYVYLIHDLYPAVAVELGLVDEGGLVERLWHRINGRFLMDADRIIVLGESMRSEVLLQYDAVDDSRVDVIHNWEDESVIKPMPKSENSFARENGTMDTFTVVYSGNIGRFHELETVIDATDRLRSDGHDMKFLLIGEGARKLELQEYVSRNDIDGVEFLPYQPIGRLPESLTCGDVSLVGIQRGMEGLCVSSKLYPSLAAGTPILAVVGEGDEVHRIVDECDCGERVAPGNVDECVEVIQGWMRDREYRERQGRNARQCLEERFTFDHARSQYEETLETVLLDDSG